MTATINVSIVEDEAGLRRELATLINAAPGFHCLQTYPHAEAAADLAEVARPLGDAAGLDEALAIYAQPKQRGRAAARRRRGTAADAGRAWSARSLPLRLAPRSNAAAQ